MQGRRIEHSDKETDSYGIPGIYVKDVDRKNGVASVSIPGSTEKFDILYRVTDEELARIKAQCPGLAHSNFYITDNQNPDRPHKIVLGEGNFSSARLASHVTESGITEYFAVRKIKDLPGQKDVSREAVVKDTYAELELHNILKTLLNDSPYLKHFSLVFKTIKALNTKGKEQLYQFIPLADLGDGVQFAQRVRDASFCPKERKNLLESISSSLIGSLFTAHQARFFLNDIKPQNLLFSSDGNVLFSDLGSAVYLKDANQSKSASHFYDSQYAPPLLLYKNISSKPKAEQSDSYRFERLSQIKHIHDRWSLGLTLLYLYHPDLANYYIEVTQGVLRETKKSTPSKINKNDVIAYYNNAWEKVCRHEIYAEIPHHLQKLIQDMLNPDFSQTLTPGDILGRFKKPAVTVGCGDTVSKMIELEATKGDYTSEYSDSMSETLIALPEEPPTPTTTFNRPRSSFTYEGTRCAPGLLLFGKTHARQTLRDERESEARSAFMVVGSA